MIQRFLTLLAVASLTLTATLTRGQTYSNAVTGLNPVGYWPLNEAVAPPQPLNLTAANLGTLGSVGNGYYGAWYQPSGNTWYLTNNIVQMTGPTADGDKIMNCQFAPGQYVVIPRNTNGVPNGAVTIRAPFSIETWVQVGTTSGRLGTLVSEGQVQLEAGGPNTNNPYYGGTGGTAWAGFELGQYANFFFFSCYNTNAYNNKSPELDTPKNLTVGEWVYLVATFDGTKETIYENGSQVAQKTLSPNAAGQYYVPDPTSPLMVGSGSDLPASYGVAFTGGIGQVAIYTNVLSQASMTAHYQAAGGTNATYGANYTNAVLADNPAIFLRLDDAVGQANAGYPSSTFPVATNYGSIGSVGNGVYQPGTTPGVAGPSYAGFGPNSQAVAINGWLGAVDVGNSNIPAELNPTGASPLTVVSWFKSGPADAPGRFQEIVGHSDASYRMAMGHTAAGLQFNPGPGPELLFTNASDVAKSGFAFNDGQWHMIAGVSDGTNEYLYLDGVVAKTNGNSAGLNITGSTRDLLLGGDPQYTYATRDTADTIRNFDGDIAQVAFFTNALTAGQVQSLFDAAGVPPYIWEQPVASVAINAEQNLSVAAAARGSSTVTYQWYDNGVAVTGQTNATLAFSPINTNNAGSYYLVADNSYGAATSSVVNITVYGAPTIQEQSPTDLQIFSGASPTLHVTATGATLAYQWTLNSAPITDATNSSYTVTNVSSAGTYGCTITNFLGTASINPITINVLADPTAPFPSSVLADGAVAYFRLDEANGATTAYDYVGGNNGSYTNVYLGLPGYTSNNSTPSDPNETCGEFGDYPAINPNNDYAGNMPSYLNFGTRTGNAEFTVEAWVNQYLMQGSGNAIVALGYGGGGEQFVLDTGNLVGSDGALRFFVRNAAGSVSTAQCTNIIANDNTWHHVAGVCDEAGGHVYLYLDGKLVGTGNITAGSGLLTTTFPLSIGARESANVTPANYDFQFLGEIDDVALYSKALTASQVQSHYFDSGVAPYGVAIQPSNVTTNQGATVTFTATAQGTPPLGEQWYDNNNNPIAGQTNTTLMLTNLQQGQSGNYTFTVTNSYGSVSASASLSVVLGPPTLTQDVQPANATVYAGDPVTLSIQVSGSLPLYYQWYQDGQVISGANSASYSFAALQGTNTYYCVVTNAYSYSQAGGPTVSSTATVAGIAYSTVTATNFNSRMKITFSGYNRGETLAAFPVLVRFSTNTPGFSYAEFSGPNGSDLRFADASGTRELPYEIDQWDDSNGVSSVWVQVPRLSGTNDFIWAYWGSSDTTTPGYTTNGAVWEPASFLGLPGYDTVYHLKENGFPFADSTLDYTSTNGVAPSPLLGIVGNGEAFDGVSKYLDSGTATLPDAFTLSAWVDLSSNAFSIQTIFANQRGGYGSPGFAWFVNFYNSTNQAMLLDTGDGTSGSELSTAGNVVSYGQWHQVAAAINRTNGTVNFYVDGASVPVVSGSPMVTDFVNNADLNVGRFTNSFAYFNGTLDESRIHSGVESSNWVWASYMTVASNNVFATYSSVSNTIALPVLINIEQSGASVILTWPTGTLQSATDVEGPYSDVLGATSPYTNTITGSQEFFRVHL